MPTPQNRPSPLKSWRLWAGAATLVVLAAAGGGTVGYNLGHSAAERERAEADASAAAAAAAASDSRLSEAYQQCRGADQSNTLELGDGGDSIIVDTRSEYTSVAGVNCALDALETPQSIRSSIASTTALMGSRDAEHDGLLFSWSYHPDNGLNMVITNEG